MKTHARIGRVSECDAEQQGRKGGRVGQGVFKSLTKIQVGKKSELAASGCSPLVSLNSGRTQFQGNLLGVEATVNESVTGIRRCEKRDEEKKKSHVTSQRLTLIRRRLTRDVRRPDV